MHAGIKKIHTSEKVLSVSDEKPEEYGFINHKNTLDIVRIKHKPCAKFMVLLWFWCTLITDTIYS